MSVTEAHSVLMAGSQSDDFVADDDKVYVLWQQ